MCETLVAQFFKFCRNGYAHVHPCIFLMRDNFLLGQMRSFILEIVVESLQWALYSPLCYGEFVYFIQGYEKAKSWSKLWLKNAKQSFKVVTWLHLWSIGNKCGTHLTDSCLIPRWSLKIGGAEPCDIRIVSIGPPELWVSLVLRRYSINHFLPQELWVSQWYLWRSLVWEMIFPHKIILDEYMKLIFSFNFARIHGVACFQWLSNTNLIPTQLDENSTLTNCRMVVNESRAEFQIKRRRIQKVTYFLSQPRTLKSCCFGLNLLNVNCTI